MCNVPREGRLVVVSAGEEESLFLSDIVLELVLPNVKGRVSTESRNSNLAMESWRGKTRIPNTTGSASVMLEAAMSGLPKGMGAALQAISCKSIPGPVVAVPVVMHGERSKSWF
jgi:hypothetical protein